MINKIKPLIKSGGGTGPMKPGNQALRQGANSRKMRIEKVFFSTSLTRGFLILN